MPDSISLPAHWIRGLAVFVGIAAALYLAAIVASGAQASLASMSRLGWPLAAVGAALFAISLLLRFARWQWLIARLGRVVPAGYNLRVYVAGLALTSSPGKLGETLRSVLLLRRGVPVAGSLGAFLADRGADVVGMAALGAAAGWWLGQRSLILELVVVGLIGGSWVLAWVVRHGRTDRLLSRLAADPRRAVSLLTKLTTPLTAWARLWRPGASLAYALFAFAAYGLQAVVFSLYVDALGADLELARSVLIFSTSILLGAASLVPGGLGATEAALVYQLTDAGMPLADAVAATIALRLSTLWFAILLGVAALLSFAGRERAALPSGKET